MYLFETGAVQARVLSIPWPTYKTHSTHLSLVHNDKGVGRCICKLHRVQDSMAFRFSNPNKERRRNEKNLKKKSIIIKIANTHKKKSIILYTLQVCIIIQHGLCTLSLSFRQDSAECSGLVWFNSNRLFFSQFTAR